MAIWYDATGYVPRATDGTPPPCAIGQSFTVPSNNQKLTILKVICEAVGFTGSFAPQIDLYSDAADSIGALITNLSPSAVTPVLIINTPTLVDFSAQITNPILNAGKYWIVLSDPASTGANYPGAFPNAADTEFNEGIGGGVCNSAAAPNATSPELFLMQVGGIGNAPAIVPPNPIIIPTKIKLIKLTGHWCDKPKFQCQVSSKGVTYKK